MKKFREIFTLVILSQFVCLSAEAQEDVIFKNSFERCELIRELPPGTVEWDGGGDGTSWSDPANWKGNVLPADGGSVSIKSTGENTVIYDASLETTRISYLDGCDSLSITGGTLELDGEAWVRADLELTSGTLNVSGDLEISGTLDQSGGTLSGIGMVTAAGPFNWSGGTQQDSGETVANGGMVMSGTALKWLHSRTLTLQNNESTWTGSGNLRLWDAATINNNSPFNIQTDADMTFYTGAGSTLNNNGTLTKSADSGLTNIDANFNNSGSVSVTSGELQIGRNNQSGTSSGSFQIAAGKILGIRGNHDMTGASSFSGAGAFNFIGGGTTTINGSYTVTGPLGVQGGVLNFQIPVTFPDDVSVSSGTLQYTQAPTSINADVYLSGNGTLTTSVALPISGALNQSGGTLGGLGMVTITGLFNWSGGTQQDSGVTVANSGMVMSGTGLKWLHSRTLTLQNNESTWTGSGNLRLWDAATINNNSPFNIQTDADMAFYTGAGSTLNNNSTLTKSAGSGLTSIDANFNNSGSVSVTSGELQIGRNNQSGTSSGSFQIAAGKILGIRGNHDMTGASSFSGAGAFNFIGGGTTTINGSYTVTGPLGVQGGVLNFQIPVTFPDDVSVSSGTLQYTQAPTSINADVYLSGNGTLTTSVALPISGALNQSGGTLGGLGMVTITGLFNWSGGTQQDSGVTVANSGMVMSGTGLKWLHSRTLTLQNNESTWTGSGNLRLWDAATINNNSPFNIQTDADMAFYTGAGSTLNNNSTLTKSAGSGLTSIDANFNNSGSVSVTSGELQIGRNNQSGTSSGSFQIAAGKILGIRGNHDMTGASSFSGAGAFNFIGGGTTTINGSYTVTGPLGVQGGVLNFQIPVTFPDDVSVSSGTLQYTQAPTSINADVYLSGNGTLTTSVALPISGALNQSGGTLGGLGMVTITGLFNWSGGTQQDSGVTVANSGMVMSGTGLKWLHSRTLTLQNNESTWTGSGNLRLWDAATINNNSPFNIQTDADMAFYTGAGSTLNNNSTLTKSAGSGLTSIDANFNNSGSVSVTSGELQIGRNNQSGTSSGSFQIAAGKILGIRGNHDMTGASSFSGAGAFNFIGGGTTTINGSYTVTGPLGVQGGVLNFQIPVTFPDDVSVSSGTLQYTQAPTSINADVYLSGNGTLTTSVALPISGALNQSGGTLGGLGMVTITGLFNWSGGTQQDSGVTVANSGMVMSGTGLKWLHSRTLTLQNNESTWTGSGNLRLWDAATINNNSPFNIQTDADMAFYTGAVSTLNNNSTFTKSAGAGLTNIDASFMNFDTVSITSGDLGFGRTFSQDLAGTLYVRISSTGFDSYAVSQSATLDGTLDIDLLGGFEPDLGATFQIMTFASRIPNDAEFFSVSGLAIGNGKKFVVNYGATDVTLEVVADP